MTILTLELPDTLAQQLQKKHIGEVEIRAIALAALELWLANADHPAAAEARKGGRFSESAVPFLRRLIAQNQQLFETLARQ